MRHLRLVTPDERSSPERIVEMPISDLHAIGTKLGDLWVERDQMRAEKRQAKSTARRAPLDDQDDDPVKRESQRPSDPCGCAGAVVAQHRVRLCPATTARRLVGVQPTDPDFDVVESAQRIEFVNSLLTALGLSDVAIDRWWNAAHYRELRDRTPAQAWASGDHLGVEQLVADATEEAESVARRYGSFAA
jgi:hypothetical protein